MQYHFKGRGFSGRAVRLKQLDPTASDDALLSAAKISGEDATGLEIKKAQWRIGIKQFITEFSDKCVDPTDPTVKWRGPKGDDFDDLGKFFTTKDLQALEAIYREYHEVLPSELNEIVGKAIALSED